MDALGFAVDGGLEIAVRSGGHNVAGRAVCDDGLMIDLSLIKGSHLGPKAGTVRVQAGVTWGEFNRETQLHGLATRAAPSPAPASRDCIRTFRHDPDPDLREAAARRQVLSGRAAWRPVSQERCPLGPTVR